MWTHWELAIPSCFDNSGSNHSLIFIRSYLYIYSALSCLVSQVFFVFLWTLVYLAFRGLCPCFFFLINTNLPFCKKRKEKKSTLLFYWFYPYIPCLKIIDAWLKHHGFARLDSIILFQILIQIHTLILISSSL